MSLEERIRRFAEQARGYLLEEFARSTQKDTEVVQWQGYNEDGKLLAKNKDLVPTVDGLGQKYATKGSDLILDSAGSVEQRKARRRQQEVAPKREAPPIPPIPFVPRSANPLIQLFDETAGEFTDIFQVGDYIVTYRNLSGTSRNTIASTNSFGDGFGEIWESNYGFNGTASVFVPTVDRSFVYKTFCNSYNCKPDTVFPVNATPNDVFSVIVASASGRIFDFGTFTIDPQAEITVGSETKSWRHTQTPSSQGFHYYDANIVNFGKRYSTDLTVNVGGATNGPTWGNIDYVCKTNSTFLCNDAKYYYTFSNEGTVATRIIDLNTILDGDFYVHEKIHEYRTRVIVGSDEQVILYSVFFVTVIDTENQYEDVINSNPQYRNTWGGVGKFTPYFVHTKLNLTTGQISSKKTQASIRSGLSVDGIRYMNGITDYLSDLPASSRTNLASEYPFGAFMIYHFGNGISTGHMFRVDVFRQYNRIHNLVDPSPIFSNAYSEDWISNFAFDDTGYASTTYNLYWDRLVSFLNLSYYDGVFYGHRTGSFIPYPETAPCSVPNSTTITKTFNNYGDLPSTLNISEMYTISINLVANTPPETLDLSSWGQYNAARIIAPANDTVPAKTTKYYGPLFPIGVAQDVFSYCYENYSRSESYRHLLASNNLDYIFNDPIGYSTVPLVQYEAINGEINLTTKFAHNFAVNDTVAITGTQDINGTYTVIEVTTNLNFKVSLDIDDTDGLIDINGTATKQ